ncbi:MAG TPA: MBOAT family O-acyltransferase [Polyangiaceae bacterium]|nr:MBOAT family O-acyltransferase [Polyangiaceae bacterium]
MLFNSLEYLVFLPLVAAVSWVLPRSVRWAWLLGASWYFYGSYGPRYLVLFIANTAVAYLTGLGLGRWESRGTRRLLAAFGVGTLLTTLFVFKYLGFLLRSFGALLELLGVHAAIPDVELTLPVGVSFYTFQAIAYIVDVYRGAYPVERHPGIFALYKAFFVQLVAGPIERPHRLLPQLREPKPFDRERFVRGAALVLWGMAKKVVIADRLALYVNEVYGRGRYRGLPVIVATYLFAFQIYCDFSGYSDIALGSARILGYDLMQNFDRPYLSRSVREFWTRWHISLSTWFRDYVYIPLGGNRVSPRRTALNISIVFLVSGLWHGAAWTFVAWGALHGLYMLVGMWTEGFRKRVAERVGLTRVPRLHALIQCFVVFHLVTFAWVFFRAPGFREAWRLLQNATKIEWSWSALAVKGVNRYELAIGVVGVALMTVLHLWQRGANTADFVQTRSRPVRWALYYAMGLAIMLFGQFNLTEFIYFRF